MNEKIEYQPVKMDMLYCIHQPESCIKYNSKLTREAEEEYHSEYDTWRKSESGKKIIEDFLEEQRKLEIKTFEEKVKTEKYSTTRYNICKSCDRFNTFTKFCGECNCLMPVKVIFKNVRCPIDKWIEVEQ